jgi:hypothetical protein
LPKGYTVPQRDDNPPICKNNDCDNPRVPMAHHWFTGAPVYRPICQSCHQHNTASKHGLKNISQVVAKNAGFKSITGYLNHMAKLGGYTSHRDKLNQQAIAEGYEGYYDKLNQLAIDEGYESLYDKKNQEAIKEGYRSISHKLNAKHPYRRYRKDYCENIDGRLGFQCTTTITWDGMLDVDHIDGHYKNNDPLNLQTLCKCCHAYKTNLYKDYSTPGRSALKSLGIDIPI